MMKKKKMTKILKRRSGRSLTKSMAGCDSPFSAIRTRHVVFTSGRKDMMSSSVTAPLTCGGGRNMATGQFGTQKAKSSWRTARERRQT